MLHGTENVLWLAVEVFLCFRSRETGDAMQVKAEGFQTVNRSRDADSLRVAFGREGCPVCIVVLDYLERSMDSWEYEGFSDVEHRHELIQSRGFCPLHTWQLAQNNAPFQLAVVYQEVLTEILDDLNRDTHALAAVSLDETAPETAWKKLWKKKGRKQKLVGPA